jgi:hypothetical protein
MKFFKLIILFFISLSLTGCADLLNPDWSKTAEPDGKKRARDNVEKGKGISMLYGGKKGTNFQFASSNPLWRASLDTLDFMVLSTVDYAGGLIISDWYSENNPNESIKITVRFLTNEIRSDALNVSIHKKSCQNLNCTTKKIVSDLSFEIKDKILNKAALYVKNSEDKAFKENEKQFKISDRDRY